MSDDSITTGEIKILLARLDTKVDTILEHQRLTDSRAQDLEVRVRTLENHKSRITGAVTVIGSALVALFTYILRKF